MSGARPRAVTSLCLVLAGSFLLATAYTGFNPFDVLQRGGGVWTFLAEDFWPPVFAANQSVWSSILVTVALAIEASFLGAVLAFLAAVFGSPALSTFGAAGSLIRAGATFLRNIPTLVWAFILFSALGVGTGVGFMALWITSFAFLTRAFIEVIDELSADNVESMRAVGASFWQQVMQSVLPNCMEGFISWFLYCLEVNIRASTVVGMVGGGGIGLLLFSYLKSFKYASAAGIICLVAAMVIAVDACTSYLRRKVVE